MKKIFIYLAAAVLTFNLSSCDALFDSLEGDLSKMSETDLTGSEAGLDRLVASLYSSLPMGAFSEGDKYTLDAAETDGSKSVAPSGVPGFWNYTTMRDVNVFIKAIEKAKNNGTISEALYNSYLGEAHFIRGYFYFGSVRIYGGVPIVTEPLDEYFDGGENEGLYVARSTEKDTWDFVLSELDEAAKLLPSERTVGKYRATKWSALALKSRAALYAASVSRYWEKAAISNTYDAVKEELTFMKEAYAANYYQQCIDASEQIINSGLFELYGKNPSSVKAAVDNYTNLFLSRQDCEWLFGRSYNNGVNSNSNGVDLKNSPNQAHGSGTGVWKFGCYGVTIDLVDQFDNYDENFGAIDGTIKTRVDGNESAYVATPYSAGLASILSTKYVKYDNPSDPFKDKDARFQAYVIYPDAVFRNTTIKIQGGLWKSDGSLAIYDESNPHETVNGVDYYLFGAASETNFSGFYKRGATNDGSWYTTGFGLRKYLDPTTALSYSQNPWYDLRYTEILLNYCEAQVELNGTNAGKSKEYLNDIRHRAYFQDEKDATLDNVLKERRVELAFEDDYAMTLQRRRAFYNTARDSFSNPNGGRRHALIPVADLRDGKPGYIFVRANFFADDTDKKTEYNVEPKAYYGGISNYNVNKITPNPSQQ